MAEVSEQRKAVMGAPIIETDRLLMRPPLACDLDGWAAFSADETAMHFLGGVQQRSVAWRSMASAAGSWSLQGFGSFSVILRETGQWIGRVGPIRPEGWPAAEVGWGILPAFQGQGYAREAATAATSFAFDRLGWDAISHVIAPDNLASHAVARALGSCLLGPTQLPAPYETSRVDLWGQSRAQWQSRQGARLVRVPGKSSITVTADPDAAAQAAIGSGLDIYNQSPVGPDPTRPLWVTCRDSSGQIIGGARCLVMWHWLLVDWLWVAEGYRRAGLGSILLRRAEQSGMAEGCTGAMLNTFSFQAPDFYRRHGYELFGQLADQPPGETRYWMSKHLNLA